MVFRSPVSSLAMTSMVLALLMWCFLLFASGWHFTTQRLWRRSWRRERNTSRLRLSDWKAWVSIIKLMVWFRESLGLRVQRLNMQKGVDIFWSWNVTAADVVCVHLRRSIQNSYKINRPFAQLLVWVRDGASGDGRSITCTWIAPRTARNGDKKSTSRPSETPKLHVGDWPTVTGCPVSNPGNNCANGLLLEGNRKPYYYTVWEIPRSRYTQVTGRRRMSAVVFACRFEELRLGHTFGSMRAWQPKCGCSETDLLLAETFI